MRTANIITLNGYSNYGNRLQNYALTRTLEEMSISATTPWNCSIKDTIKAKIKHLFFVLPKFRKESRLFQFTKNYNKSAIHTKNVDFIIHGSDQVWNPFCIKSNKKLIERPYRNGAQISYAASMGVTNLDSEEKKYFACCLNKYKAISVREQSAKELLQPLINKKIEVVLDPTLLLNQKEYESLEHKPKYLKEDEKYVLCYILGNREQQEIIKKYADQKGLKVILFSDKRDSSYGVEEFLYLIHHAQLICTDSFHACVFSFIFERPFVAFKRTGEANYMYTRLQNLINTFKLKNREFNGKEITKENLEVDYTEAKKILKKEQKKSLDFLKRALDIKDEN